MNGKLERIRKVFSLVPAILGLVGGLTLVLTSAPLGELANPAPDSALGFFQFISVFLLVSGVGQMISLLTGYQLTQDLSKLVESFSKLKGELGSDSPRGKAIAAGVLVVIAGLLAGIVVTGYIILLAILNSFLSLFWSGAALALVTTIAWTLLVRGGFARLAKAVKSGKIAEALPTSRTTVGQWIISGIHTYVLAALLISHGFWAAVGAQFVLMVIVTVPYLALGLGVPATEPVENQQVKNVIDVTAEAEEASE
jgi:hypothetical protein